MPSVLVAGGGLAGLAAAAALGDAGFDVDVFESRPYPGGRATSYAVPGADGSSEVVDNCQHILLRCCTNLLDFYRRLRVSDGIEFHDRFYFIEPGGRVSEFQAGLLPPPAHFLGAFAGLRFLNLREKAALVRGILACQRERTRGDLDEITMAEWLAEHDQPERVVQRFWRQVLVSAVNEELDRMAAIHGFQVMNTGFLGNADSWKMGVPSVPLGELYAADAWRHLPRVRLHLRKAVESLNGTCRLADGSQEKADFYLLAVPFERAAAIVAGLQVPAMDHSPITGVHLWFNRPVTDLPHATLLDRTTQWMFNKGGGQQVQLVISASRALLPMGRQEIIDLCCRELAEFFPAAAEARLLRAHVVKEVRATFSATPGLNARRPGPATFAPNVFLAGDWTNTGWPATMEGAVRSGYLAAEAITRAAGNFRPFLVPE